MRFWIDIANAPHVALFRPVAKALEALGHEMFFTVFDRGITAPVAAATWPKVTVVGHSFRRPLLGKASAVVERTLALRRIVKGRCDIALSHNSYSQIVTARSLGLPTITAMDYEHQPANHLAFRLAHRVLLPQAIPEAAVRSFGLRANRILRYSGIKEDVALADFSPTPGFRASIGVPENTPLVVLRGPPEGAAYHRGDNPLFDAVIARIVQFDAHVLLSPRTRSQADSYRSVSGLRVLETPTSGAQLLYAADLFVGGGGTMTREAAVLGTPTYTVFAGRPAAVDQYLAERGRLRVLRDVSDLPATAERKIDRPWVAEPGALEQFVGLILAAAKAVARRPID